MSTQRHINGHAGSHVVAQDFNNFTHRFSATRRTLGQLNHDHKAHTSTHHLFRRDQDIKAQAAVVRDDKPNASVGEVATDNLAGFRHQYAHNTRFATTFTVRSQRLCQHLIAMNTGFHLLAGQVQVIFAAFNAQKAVAITVANNGTFQQVKTLRQRIALTTSEDQLPVTLHGAQAATQRFLLLFTFNVEFSGQLIAVGRFFTFS